MRNRNDRCCTEMRRMLTLADDVSSACESYSFCLLGQSEVKHRLPEADEGRLA